MAQRVRIRYHGRNRDAVSERKVSPQRLMYYRDNRYLDVWCHLRGVLRCLALERIRDACPLAASARDIPDAN